MKHAMTKSNNHMISWNDGKVTVLSKVTFHPNVKKTKRQMKHQDFNASIHGSVKALQLPSSISLGRAARDAL